MPAAVTDLPTALLTGLAAGLATLISAIPSILGALLILLLGWIITGALAGALARALRALRVNAAADRAGVTGVLQRAQIRSDVAGVIAGVVKWFGFGVIAAATQIGVAAPLVELLFAGIVFGLALAFGLAFGLGGRDEAAQMWRGLRSSAGTVTSRSAVPANEGNGHPIERTEHAIRT